MRLYAYINDIQKGQKPRTYGEMSMWGWYRFGRSIEDCDNLEPQRVVHGCASTLQQPFFSSVPVRAARGVITCGLCAGFDCPMGFDISRSARSNRVVGSRPIYADDYTKLGKDVHKKRNWLQPDLVNHCFS